MDVKSLPQELKRWVTEEFQLPARKMPSDSFFRKLCLGQGVDIWKYVTRHVYHQKNVKTIRGNLQWYRELEKLEVKKGECYNQADRRKAMQREVQELRDELEQLDSQIALAQNEVLGTEKSVEDMWRQITESRKRSILLRSFAEQCIENRQKLSTYINKINNHSQVLEELARKAEVVLVFGKNHTEENLSIPSVGLEPQVLREVKEICQERFNFFHTLLESELGVAPSCKRLSHQERNAAFQHWLSAVEDLIRSHPPSHLLAALEHLALLRQEFLKQKTADIDVSRDIEKLRFRIESKHLQDVSNKHDFLPSVKLLLQEGWNNVHDKNMQLAAKHAHNRELLSILNSKKQEAFQQLSMDSEKVNLSRSAFDLELQLEMSKALRDGLQKQCQDLIETAKDKEEALLKLQNKWQNIMSFRQLVDKKQEQIRGLIKGNSSAKSELLKVQAEIELFVQEKLQRHHPEFTAVAGEHQNSVSRELRQFSGIALTTLSRRCLEEVQLVPAHKFSIYRIDMPSPYEKSVFDSLCQSLHFAHYMAPEKLIFSAVALKREHQELLYFLNMKKKCLQKIKQLEGKLPASDLQALLDQVKAEDQELVTTLLPTVQRLSQQSSQCIEYGAEVKKAIVHWWEQPAQFALPEERRHGLTVQQWIERWSMAAKALQQSQRTLH
ncbi:HAUS augmin-like complex subunit 5 [Polypterus senegalus]|uniref:HAUS augmin-like complex subunit 5 n=1 Tax=Polypterus senegalus TaxID=55291 RepID=UPI001964497A|nr:HAUS augmin-like complex subunit 5 [Polypterus senegalus]XP_039629572.1 HAUS augmin-like complex subunit 5 [Polypterus senegalus]